MYAYLLHVTMFFLTCTPPARAGDTLFRNAGGMPCPGEEAISYRVLSGMEQGLYGFCEYNKQHRLLKSYTTMNASGSILHGRYAEYNLTGKMLCTGANRKGYPCGEWIYFTDGGKTIEKRSFDSLGCYYMTAFDSMSGGIMKEGLLDAEGRRAGEWKEYFETGICRVHYRYEHGRKNGVQKEYHRNGILKREEFFSSGALERGMQYDSNSGPVPYHAAFTYPQYRESPRQYVLKKVPCAAIFLEKKEIVLKLRIRADGSVQEVDIESELKGSCMKELEQAIRNMKRWKPAMLEGQAIEFTMEVRLRSYAPRE